MDYGRFHAVLSAAQTERHMRDDLVKGPNSQPECGWVAFEREVMHREVNQARADHGLAAIPLEQVQRVENLAVGHSDYTKKFALYCAELAAGIDRPHA